MDYIFIGGTPRGYEVLKTLIGEGHPPDYAVVLKEDEHETNQASPDITKLLDEKRIPYSLKKKIGPAETEIIKQKKREFAVVCGWRTLIDPSLDEYFHYGFLAAHDSLLPKYRGFAPINWAMICGETETGVTLFRIQEGETDSGPVCGQKTVSIDEDDYAEDVYKKIIKATTELYLEFIADLGKGTISFMSQDESQATYTCKRTPADGKINWHLPAAEVLNFIKALAPPYPGAFCYFGGEKYIIHRAGKGLQDEKKYVKNIPGRVIQVDESGIEVMCGERSVFITSWSKNGVVSNPRETVKSITATLE